jgi:hypothetical protein
MMQVRPILLAATLSLVAVAYADGSGEYSATGSLDKLDTKNWQANPGLLAQENSNTESPTGQGDDADDCS